ncbi:MAG TPA: hypothetical protein VGS96_07750, partial [Thermoanaerobaculia bacterium]|nr:hypothetical protein [Thermoanaerobaculia bacterium]
MRDQVRRLLIFATFVLAVTVQARVISYAPYTDRTAYPAHQSRMNGHFLLLEAVPFSTFAPVPAATYGQLVLYDFEGAEEPRVVFPQDGSNAIITAAALRETDGGTPMLFVQASKSGQNGYVSWLSVDGGSTWKTVDVPTTLPIPQLGVTGADNGGPFASYRYSQVRIGSADFPFVVTSGGAVYAIAANGTAKKLYEQTPGLAPSVMLAGRDRAGTQFLLRTNSQLISVDLNGATKTILSSFISQQPSFEGFITADGSAYIDERATNSQNGKLWYVRAGIKAELFSIRWTDNTTPTVFAVPTADYSGAWIIERGGGRPTTLYLHTAANDLQKMWDDITAPDVEALHAGSSGNKVLVQVHRPRPAVDQRIFKDPALAVWHVGDPAPRTYDELFMNEQWNKGFIHVDVEKIEAGEPFVFDSGAAPTGGGGGVIISPPTSGGGDVLQEWGVVRASLKQRLVLPTVGRTHGAFGSDWVSDVIIQNPLDSVQKINLRYVPSGDGIIATEAKELTITLGASEIRLISDIVGSLFQIESGI